MKTRLLLLSFFVMTLIAGTYAQQGVAININADPPDPSAMLDVQSTDKGVLVPRMTQTERNNIALPQTGLLIYQTDNTPGFYYNAGTPATPNWQAISGQGGQWTNSGGNIYYNSGNVGIGLTNPGYQLHVHQMMKAEGGIFGDGSSRVAVGYDFWGGETGLYDWNEDKLIAGRLVAGTVYQYGGEPHSSEGLFIDNGNVGIGTNTPAALLDVTGDALISGLTIGTGSNPETTNTALGSQALQTNSIGVRNTAAGATALRDNFGGSWNTATGYSALAQNIGGSNNTAIGNQAMALNETGNYNTAVGSTALYFNKGRSRSTAIGHEAMHFAFNGSAAVDSYNTAVGFEALRGNANPVNNSGQYNTALGDQALRSNRNGSRNTATGRGALYTNTSGENNTATGQQALHLNTTGTHNYAGGSQALYSNTSGIANVAAGYRAGYGVTEGDSNIFVGYRAGHGITTGNNNIVIGNNITAPLPAGDKQLVLGAQKLLYGDLDNLYIGIGTTSPSAQLHVNGTGQGEGNVVFVGEVNFLSSDPPVSGAGTRMMWYPDKAAFRAGEVEGTNWDGNMIGYNSVAMGRNTKASGFYSMAMGYNTTASGEASTAMGYSTEASGFYSTAMGNDTYAFGDASTAMGRLTEASGDYSTAMGDHSTASGFVSTAMGSSTIASGLYSTAMGRETEAVGDYSTAMGYQTLATGYYSTAMGGGTLASGEGATAMGAWSNASGSASIAMGHASEASGDYSTAMGSLSKAVGESSFAINLSGSVGPNVGANTFQISGAASIGGNVAWTNYSDKRLKKDIEYIKPEDNLQKIMQLNAVRYRWKEHDKLLNLGFIAQDVEGIVPESVRYDGPNDIYSMEYTAIIPVLVEAMKEQQVMIEELRREIEEMKASGR
jgi:trimeric autotransporter adhesin